MALTKRAFDPYILKDLGWYIFSTANTSRLSKHWKVRGHDSRRPGMPFLSGAYPDGAGQSGRCLGSVSKTHPAVSPVHPGLLFPGPKSGKAAATRRRPLLSRCVLSKKEKLQKRHDSIETALKHTQDDEKRKRAQEWLSKMGGKKDKDKSKEGG